GVSTQRCGALGRGRPTVSVGRLEGVKKLKFIKLPPPAALALVHNMSFHTDSVATPDPSLRCVGKQTWPDRCGPCANKTAPRAPNIPSAELPHGMLGPLRSLLRRAAAIQSERIRHQDRLDDFAEPPATLPEVLSELHPPCPLDTATRPCACAARTPSNRPARW